MRQGFLNACIYAKQKTNLTWPDFLERVLNWTAFFNSTAEKCTPMQVIKQPEHGRMSTTKEQK